jgi:hypothetical protein
MIFSENQLPLFRIMLWRSVPGWLPSNARRKHRADDFGAPITVGEARSGPGVDPGPLSRGEADGSRHKDLPDE